MSISECSWYRPSTRWIKNLSDEIWWEWKCEQWGTDKNSTSWRGRSIQFLILTYCLVNCVLRHSKIEIKFQSNIFTIIDENKCYRQFFYIIHSVLTREFKTIQTKAGARSEFKHLIKRDVDCADGPSQACVTSLLWAIEPYMDRSECNAARLNSYEWYRKL